jgi:DNA-binding NarL/FixJ family response regulator
MKDPILSSIVLAEDHAVVRQGLCGLLASAGGFRIVGEARDGREAVALSLQLRPDVVLMDIAMPVLNGLEATRQILAAWPAARIIILSAHSDDAYIQHTSLAGSMGFLEKQSSAETLVRALHEVLNGRPYFSPSIVRRLKHSIKPVDRDGQPLLHAARLTTRESEVLQLVAEGCANKQVAAALGISIKTVEKHRQHLMEKLNIHDTAGLTRYAIAAGVIESSVQLTVRD